MIEQILWLLVVLIVALCGWVWGIIRDSYGFHKGFDRGVWWERKYPGEHTVVGNYTEEDLR